MKRPKASVPDLDIAEVLESSDQESKITGKGEKDKLGDWD